MKIVGAILIGGGVWLMMSSLTSAPDWVSYMFFGAMFYSIGGKFL